jgi:hypothetical protein
VLSAALARLDGDLLKNADPERLAAAFPVGLGAPAWRGLNETPRTSERLAAWIGRQLASGSGAADLQNRPEHRLALLDGDGLIRASLHAGAAWHAHSVRALVERALRTRLIDAIGEDAFAFGLAETERAVAPRRPDLADLGAAIMRDGALSLAAWVASAPPAIAVRAALKLPAALDAGPPEPLHHAYAGPILARVADILVPDADP